MNEWPDAALPALAFSKAASLSHTWTTAPGSRSPRQIACWSTSVARPAQAMAPAGTAALVLVGHIFPALLRDQRAPDDAEHAPVVPGRDRDADGTGSHLDPVVAGLVAQPARLLVGRVVVVLHELLAEAIEGVRRGLAVHRNEDDAGVLHGVVARAGELVVALTVLRSRAADVVRQIPVDLRGVLGPEVVVDQVARAQVVLLRDGEEALALRPAHRIGLGIAVEGIVLFLRRPRRLHRGFLDVDRHRAPPSGVPSVTHCASGGAVASRRIFLGAGARVSLARAATTPARSGGDGRRSRDGTRRRVRARDPRACT